MGLLGYDDGTGFRQPAGIGVNSPGMPGFQDPYHQDPEAQAPLYYPSSATNQQQASPYPTSAQVQGNPSQYAGTPWGAALLPDSPGNIWTQQNARLNGTGQMSDFMSPGSQPAGRPGQVWDPVSQSYRGANEPPAGAVRTNNPNVYVLPNGSTWNTPGYSNNVTTDQGYDQFRQQTFGVGNPTGAGIYGNTQGAGAGQTNLGGPGIPFDPNGTAAQKALMPQQYAQLGYPVPTAPPPQVQQQGLRSTPGNFAPAGTQYPGSGQQFAQYTGSNYPVTPGMPGYVYQNQPPPQQQAPPPQQNMPTDFLSFLASIFGVSGGQGQNVDPYSPYGNQQQQYSSNITQQNRPGGSQYVPTSAWDNFGAQGGWAQPADGGRAAQSSGWVDNAATLNPGQQTSGATSNGSLASQFSQPATSTDPWVGVTNRAPDYGSFGSLWRS